MTNTAKGCEITFYSQRQVCSFLLSSVTTPEMPEKEETGPRTDEFGEAPPVFLLQLS